MVREVVSKGCGEDWDGVSLAVATPQTSVPLLEISDEDWEDKCTDFGFEYVEFKEGKPKERNNYGGNV